MRRIGRFVLVMVVVFTVVVSWSIGGALLAPGTDSTEARLAEWGRDHGFDAVITWLEQQQYAHNQPKVGGAPVGGIPVADGAGPASSPSSDRGLPAPPSIPVLADGPPLPNEGTWQTVVSIKGSPAVRVAELRPDSQHTSFVAGVLWMDPSLVRGQLQPGYVDPGGSWQAPDSITGSARDNVVAGRRGQPRARQQRFGHGRKLEPRGVDEPGRGERAAEPGDVGRQRPGRSLLRHRHRDVG